jgi:hypothetical protein
MDQPKQSEKILSHIRYLCEEIGTRGSTTEGERKGAEYCQTIFEQIGLEPRWERFQSARSIFHPHLMASLMMLAAFVLYPIGGGWTAALAALLSIVALASELLELSFKDNLFRWLAPKGESQNVFVVIEPAEEHQQDLVLIGHIDTQRTPLVFRSIGWVKVYKNFTTLVFVTFAIQALLYLVGIFGQWGWIWLATIPTAICSVLLAAMCIQADLTPFTVGANDNATAVGMVLTLAEELSNQPLKHTRVWAVCTGCEEVQHYGAIDFFKRHRQELLRPRGLVFEMLGCAGPGYMVKEGIIVPFRADPELAAMAERLAKENPEWGAYPVSISGGNSELSDCVQFDVPAITLFGLETDGSAPYWHQVGDTFDKMNAEILGKAYLMTRAMINEIDGGLG